MIACPRGKFDDEKSLFLVGVNACAPGAQALTPTNQYTLTGLGQKVPLSRHKLYELI